MCNIFILFNVLNHLVIPTILTESLNQNNHDFRALEICIVTIYTIVFCFVFVFISTIVTIHGIVIVSICLFVLSPYPWVVVGTLSEAHGYAHTIPILRSISSDPHSTKSIGADEFYNRLYVY